MQPGRSHFGFGVSVAMVLFAAQPAAADCANPFAKPDEVLDFHLQTTAATWSAFRSSASSGTGCDGQYPYFPAEFRCGDLEPYLAIAFRRKRDRSETRQKLPIKLDFNHSIAGQRWPAARGEMGFRKLSLNSGQADDAGRAGGAGRPANPGTLSAILTEHLAWRLQRQELPEVSGVAYARLTLHFTDTGATQYQGLYVLIEDVDRGAVRTRFGIDNGLLVKTTDPACVDEVVFDDGPPNSASDSFATWAATNPASFPGGWYERTDQAMHLDALLRQEALRELLANTADTVLGNRNNYFALDLQGEGERRWYLPWDLDDMFRPFPQVRAADTALVRNCAGGLGCTSNAISRNIRDNAEIRPRYLEIMCRLSNGVALETKLLAELQALDSLIRPIIAAEVEPLWAPLGRDPLNAAVEGTYASEFARMKTWIPARVQAVRQLIQAEGIACPLGCQEGATATCEYLGVPSRRVCVGGRWNACQVQSPAGGAGGTAGTGAGGQAGAANATGGADPAGGAGVIGGMNSTGGGSATPGGPSSSPQTQGEQPGCACTGAKRGAGAHGLSTVALLAAIAYRRRRRPDITSGDFAFRVRTIWSDSERAEE